MKFYTIQNNNIFTAENEHALTRFYKNVKPLPKDYTEDKYLIQNNELVLNPNWEEIELNKAKQAKIFKNDTARDAAINAGVTYKNILFDSDTDQKINLLAMASSMSETDIITWYGMENDALECTKEDLENIGALITQLHTFCWTKNAEIKHLINLAETIEEVNAIAIDYAFAPNYESAENKAETPDPAEGKVQDEEVREAERGLDNAVNI